MFSVQLFYTLSAEYLSCTQSAEYLSCTQSAEYLSCTQSIRRLFYTVCPMLVVLILSADCAEYTIILHTFRSVMLPDHCLVSYILC